MRQFVCPACGAVNRVPDDRDERGATCGRCHDRMFTGAPLAVTSGQLEAHLRSTLGAAVLLNVWAPWCGVCRLMTPNFDAAAARLEPFARLLTLDADAQPRAAAELRVEGVPALFLFMNGGMVGRRSGLMSVERIVAWVVHKTLDRAAA